MSSVSQTNTGSMPPHDAIPDCPTCGKPLVFCVCDGVEPIKTKTSLLILQHPQEQDRALGTARLTALHIENAVVKIGLSWPSLSKALGRSVHDPSRWAVLYLGSAKVEDLDIGEGHAVAQTAPQGFDISLWQLVSALLVGGRTVIIEQEVFLDVERFIDTIAERRVAVLQVVPSYLEVAVSYLDQHPRRLLARRFNQAAVLAREVARLTGLGYEPLLLERTRATASQVGLSRGQRQRNVAGAFAVPPRLEARAKGRKILLIDDVITTGSTVGACARVLRRAGAARVDVLALALVTDRALIPS